MVTNKNVKSKIIFINNLDQMATFASVTSFSPPLKQDPLSHDAYYVDTLFCISICYAMLFDPNALSKDLRKESALLFLYRT